MIATRPLIPAARFVERLAAARRLAERAGLDAVLVGVGADMRYLAGYPAMPLERLTMLVIPARGTSSLVVPRLEATPARLCPSAATGDLPVVTWEEGGDAHALVARLLGIDAPEAGAPGAADAAAGVSGGDDHQIRIAVSDDLPARHLLPLQRHLANARFSLASAVLRELRMVKDPDEVALLTLAAHAADRVVAQIAGGRLVGRTEADVAEEVRRRLVAEGHDEATFAIVGSGPNSASPHHEASDRVIGAGEPIVLDIGGVLGGYGSDITRTLWVTGGDPTRGPDERFRDLFAVLHAAQATARAAVKPGSPCEAIDTAARRPIEAAGLGDAFFHRTGHGIGLEGHEEPYIIGGNEEPLRPGMAFSVEPGIYFPGEYGARIEDIVVCGPDGPVELNQAPRELYVVDG